MSRGIMFVHLGLIAMALGLGGFSIYRKGFMPDDDPNFSAIAMGCIVLSQGILIVSGLYRNRKGKPPVL
jgi:hypothetical protein